LPLPCGATTPLTIWRPYQQHGWAGIAPKPKAPPRLGRLGDFAPPIKYLLLRLTCLHPGPRVDLLVLSAARRPCLLGLVLPKRSTLAAYLAQFGSRLGQAQRAHLASAHHSGSGQRPPAVLADRSQR